MTTTPMSPFAKSIYLAKYAARDEKGELIETDWSETAQRVVPTVLAALGYGPESDEVRDLTRLVEDRWQVRWFVRRSFCHSQSACLVWTTQKN